MVSWDIVMVVVFLAGKISKNSIFSHKKGIEHGKNHLICDFWGKIGKNSKKHSWDILTWKLQGFEQKKKKKTDIKQKETVK